MKFTGERFIPEDNIRSTLAQEHWHRYMYASNFCVGKDVLDIACGEGYGSNYLSKVANSVLGCDISIETIEDAKENYTNNNLSFSVMNSCNIDLPDNSVDVITCFETIEHVDENEQITTIKEFHRVLRDNGILIISTPSTESPYHAKNNCFHKKECNYNEFINLIQQNFKYFNVIGQSIYECSIMGNCQDKDNLYIYNSQYPNFNILNEYDLLKDKYLLGVCSNQELNSEINSILINRNYGRKIPVLKIKYY